VQNAGLTIMHCTRKTLAALFLPALLALGSVAPGQQKPARPPSPPPQEDVQARIRVTTNLVVVPVTVKNAAGRIVLDITRDEFRVFEDNVEQRVDIFSNDPFPLSVVILIDNDLETRVAEQLERTLPALAAGFGPMDEVCLARFDQTFKECKGFTRDADELLTQLKRTHVQSSPPRTPAGGTLESGPKINGIPAPGASQIPPSGINLKGQPTKNVDDAVFAAANLLKDRGRERRKIILLVSDGVNSRHNRVSFNDSVRALLTGGISVYGVGVGNAYFNRGLPMVSKFRATTLSKYAHATAGDVFYAAKRDEIEDLYPTVFEEARTQYTLAYTPRGTDRSLDYHAIEVRVKRPGLSIQARDGYYSGAAPQ
jgi:VWFA-related protein